MPRKTAIFLVVLGCFVMGVGDRPLMSANNGANCIHKSGFPFCEVSAEFRYPLFTLKNIEVRDDNYRKKARFSFRQNGIDLLLRERAFELGLNSRDSLTNYRGALLNARGVGHQEIPLVCSERKFERHQFRKMPDTQGWRLASVFDVQLGGKGFARPRDGRMIFGNFDRQIGANLSLAYFTVIGDGRPSLLQRLPDESEANDTDEQATGRDEGRDKCPKCHLLLGLQVSIIVLCLLIANYCFANALSERGIDLVDTGAALRYFFCGLFLILAIALLILTIPFHILLIG